MNPSAPPDAALRDHADYMSYLASTFARLNVDGSCHTVRNYPAPK